MSESDKAAPEPQNPLADPDDFGFLYGLARAPCFRETALYSIGGSAVLGDANKAAETMVKTGCALALFHWVICRKRYYDEREATYEVFEAMKKKQAAAAMQRAKLAREKAAEQQPE